MLAWFEQHAPIRQKFWILRLGLLLPWLAALAAVAWAGNGGGLIGPALLVAAGLIATFGLVTLAKRLICDPYVITVERLEALAAGDMDSPVLFRDHSDCVGRMARAMDVFSGNAAAMQHAATVQTRIVETLDRGLLALSQADLTIRLNDPLPEPGDVLRVRFNEAVAALATSLSSAAEASHSIATASGEIRAAAADLAGRTEHQASAVQAANRTMGDVTGLVQRNTGSIVEVSRSIGDTHREATEGGRIVEDAVAAMTRIQQSSQEISQIITVIDGIAFQTNLLALNAGVEAARAGDAGKGFAVVANEVRALAQRSADAAREIKNLITSSGEQVDHGVALVGATGTALGHIVGRVGEISSLIQGIVDSSTAQLDMLTQVSKTVDDIDRSTQANAAMVEQSNAAAQGLANEAGRLAETVGAFRLSGAARPRAMAPAPAPAPRARPAPAVHGNLALKSGGDDDWSEF